jgi:hypothetical protein
LDYNWPDLVESIDADVGFTVHIHLTVHPESASPGDIVELDHGDGVIPGNVSGAAAWARSEVETVTRKWDVLHRSAAQHAVNEHLSGLLPRTVAGAMVGSAIAALSVSADDTRAAHELYQARREARLDELVRRQTAATLRFLREECFNNPASARLFLMINTHARLGVFPNAEQADDIVAEVTRWHPDALWVQIATTLQATLMSLTPDQIDELLRVLSAALHSTGHPDEAFILRNLRADADQGSRAGLNDPAEK